MIKCGQGALALLILLVLTSCATPGAPRPLQFVVLGDVPYSGMEDGQLNQLFGRLRAWHYDFIVHVGDFKDGSNQRCDDAIYADRYNTFRASGVPFVLLPGDNDWTDCRRPGAGAFDPLERLAHLRQVFFTPERSLAKDLVARTHADYPELVAWRSRDVEFVALHIVGSGDNKGFGPAGDREQATRMAANLGWLAQAAERASTARALVVLFHVNPVFERPPPVFADFVTQLAAIGERLSVPLLVIHGDTHTHQIDQPVRAVNGTIVKNITRLESFGSPEVGAVHVTVEGRPAQWRFDTLKAQP
jgi:Calcineurin-like phosphoesterase